MQIKSSLLGEVDILCLQAAFGSSELAQKSWQIFCEDWTFDDLYPDLIPFVFANIKIDDSNKFAGLMRGYHRYQWCKNQLVLQDINTILDQFNKQSIPVMLSGMVSVLHHFYADYGMRSIGFIDLITQTRDLKQGQQILNSLQAQLKSQVKLQVTTNLANGIGPRRSQACWRDAAECDILGRKASSLGCEDTLIYILSTRSHFSTMAPVTWIADMLKALQLPHAEARLNQKINQYRIAGATQDRLQDLSQMLVEATLFEKYRSVIPATDLKIGLLESMLNRTPYSGNLLAAGSQLIEQFGHRD
ncbi:hypothetical protein BH10CYA1_BH10CYA1_58640 [soil metagenome]